MSQKTRVAGLTVIVCGLAAAARAEVTPCTVIANAPYTITAPGIYCLDAPLHYDAPWSGAAITVQANDVLIDLRGHVLSGPGPDGTGNSTGVRASGYRNVTVRNGTIRAFLNGVHLLGTALVEHVHFDANMDFGIYVGGTGTVVRHNRVTRTGGPSNAVNAGWSAMGILVVGGAIGAHVVDNEVVDTVAEGTGPAYGMQIGGVGSVIERNVVTNAALGAGSSYGILVVGGKSVVAANRVVNMATGIYFYGSATNGLYRDNTVGGATAPFIGGTPVGTTNSSY